MPSTFTWLDYSERDRRRMLDVINGFHDKETIDELGIGGIRDALADLFFPGLSTIQTRARYFLFVPWIYKALEERRTPSSEVAAKARKMEVDLIGALEESVIRETGNTEREGIIGIAAREALKRLPSNIYWVGMHTYRVRLTRLSQENYHRSLDRFYTSVKAQRNDDGEPLDSGASANWDPKLPPKPEGFPHTASFDFTAQEAEYLAERIQMHARRSLFAFLIDNNPAAAPSNFFWESSMAGEFPPDISSQAEHARNFSELMFGASYLYNLMLSRARNNSDLIVKYEQSLKIWRKGIEARRDAFSRWDQKSFWLLIRQQNRRISFNTQTFVDRWISLALDTNIRNLAEVDSALRLIRERECSLKGQLARFVNPRSLELWTGASGAFQLNYRWNVAQRMLQDIRNGYGPGTVEQGGR